MSNDNIEEQLEIQMKAFESSVNTHFLTPRGFAKYFNVYLLSQQPREQGVSQELIEAGNAMAARFRTMNTGAGLIAVWEGLKRDRAKALPNSTGTMPEEMVEKIADCIKQWLVSIMGVKEYDIYGSDHWVMDYIDLKHRLSSLPWPEQGAKTTATK